MQLVLVVGGWCVGWLLLESLPRLRPPDVASSSRPRRSVIVPARDEADSLPHLLRSLRDELAPGDELLVVDDRSTDATADLARAAGATVLEPPEPPAGWTGKAWACHHGSRAATGELLVFLDADVRLGPGALDALSAFHGRSGGLVSVAPFHTTERAYERLSAMCNLVSIMGVAAGPPRDGRAHGAFGPCLAVGAADYATVGGHTAVRGEVVEDLALARRFADAGLPVSARLGDRLVRYRMYPRGLRQLIEGWSKNIATGAGTVPLVRTLGVAWWITGLLVTVQWLIESLAGAGPGWWPTVAAYAAVVAQLRYAFGRVGDFGLRWAAAYPVLLGAFVLLFARSAYVTLVRRSVTWRGRRVPVHARVADGDPG